MKQLFSHQIVKLSLKNPTYRKFVLDLLELLYRSDLGGGDITTRLLGKNQQRKIRATVKAKQNGVLAGLAEAALFWQRHGIRVRLLKTDGAKIQKGEIIVHLLGTAEKILTTERTALNLIQRMSGIATATAELIQQVGKNKIAATRKTPYGLMDSRAVVLGGGLPHRLNLADQILVKDNHLALDPSVWEKIKTNQPFEIEADTEKSALQITKHFHGKKNLILLLDNFPPAQLKILVPKIRSINPKITLEASGGITPKNIQAYLKTRVDYVSLGWLTHSARALDLSLKISI